LEYFLVFSDRTWLDLLFVFPSVCWIEWWIEFHPWSAFPACLELVLLTWEIPAICQEPCIHHQLSMFVQFPHFLVKNIVRLTMIQLMTALIIKLRANNSHFKSTSMGYFYIDLSDVSWKCCHSHHNLDEVEKYCVYNLMKQKSSLSWSGCSSFTYTLGTRHGGGLWWAYPQNKTLIPPNKTQSPTNWNLKHYISVEFLSNLNVNPPAQTWSPQFATFWRRFCLCEWSVTHFGVRVSCSLAYTVEQHCLRLNHAKLSLT